MKALILAAGYGTRLYPLTKCFPKPLLKINDKPIIDYIIEKLDRIDEIDKIFVVTNNRFIKFFKKWRRGCSFKKKIILINDLTRNFHKRRGAIKDIEFVLNKKKLKDDLLVIGGDNLFEDNLDSFIGFVKSIRSYPVVGVCDIKDRSEAKRYGVVRLDRRKRIIDFKEKPQEPESTVVAMCLYYLPKEKLNFIKEYLKQNTDKHDAVGFYISWLVKKVKVYGFTFHGHWYDIGHLKLYQDAKRHFKKEREANYGST
ncbi:MAG: nucleotidyltransferase family protein [Candidatus Omnitrophica bacterium]|nr:nucleotidyltransferase family protein [Candidatus Omnitrophota bacterium]